MNIKAKRISLENRIAVLNKQMAEVKGKLKQLQSNCHHPNLLTEHCSDYQDSWTERFCPDCGFKS